jgi:hypothetical protein
MESVDPGVVRRLLAKLDQLAIQLGAHLEHDLLDPAGVNAAVND